MAISFTMIPKKNMLVQPPQINYYPCAVMQGETTLDTLAEILSKRSTLSNADIYATLVGLTEVVGEELASGRIVRLADLGSFQVSLQGTAAASTKPNGKDRIKKARLLFKPGKNLKTMLKDLMYKRLR